MSLSILHTGRVAVASILFGLLACPAVAKDSGIKFDLDADLSGYKTYSVLANPDKPEGSPLAVGGATDTKIRNAIDKELRNQGFEPAIDYEPDFLISFDGAMEQVTDFDGLRHEISGSVTWVMDGAHNSFNRGTLVISIQDAASENTVWSAWTTEKVKDPRNPDRQIGRAVKKLLKKFPPK